MYLYNVSVIIDESNHLELMSWTQQLIQGRTPVIKFLKMLDSPHQGHTYCLQAELNNQDDIQQLRDGLIQELQEHINERHREKAFLFESVMQYLP